MKRLEDVYQIRNFAPALEDISPDVEDVDPFDVMHLSILGMPEIYRDLSKRDQQIINDSNGKIYPLPEVEREKQLQEYKRLNELYKRTRAFEKGISKYLVVKDKEK